LQAILDKIELRRWPWKIELLTPIGNQLLYIREHVLDRDTGEPTVLGAMPYPDPPPNADDDALIAWVFEQLARHVFHELAEAFHYNGVRIFDPHKGEVTECPEKL
jgi:hypothetical protein